MNTSYKAQLDNFNGKYAIQFETSNYDFFKIVEKACKKAIDKQDKAVHKERCSRMRAMGHL